MAGGAICSGLAPAAGARLQAPRAAMPAAQPVAWRRAPSLPRATPGSGGGDPTQQMSQQISPTTAEDEARVEALAARSRKAAPRGARRPIPIRNMPSSRAEEPSSSGAEWREGKLLPEGWESMDLLQRATELYMGRRGALYWANQLAWGGALVLGGAWVAFRFIGPAFGLYKLAGDLTPPPL